jgi:hypothetical protein
LVEVGPSPDSVLQFDQARQQRDAATSQLGLLKQREEMRLATREEALQAEEALAVGEAVENAARRRVNGRGAYCPPRRTFLHCDVQ